MPLSVLLLACVVAAADAKPKPPPFMPKAAKPVSVTFESGGRRLAAVWRAPRRGMPVLVLAHGVGAGKGEWERFAARLSARGFGTLAVDLRGHGGSAAREGEWKEFDAKGEWPRLKDDLLAAAAWVESRGIEPERLAFAGASIGANLASAADAARPGPFLVLLSPGFDYRGVRLAYRQGSKVLAVAARSDAYAFAAASELAGRGATLLEAPKGHGAGALDDETTLGRALDWLAKPR